jgi:ATP/maltotriose-dependent transcriptional regulator MalT
MLVRERLLALMPDALETRLVLLSAPAGFGKTTLLASWCRLLATDGVAVGWLALDEDDNNPARFLAYLHAAIARATASPGDQSGGVGAAKPGAADSAVLTRLINALAALDRDLVLVLDDYHLIGAPAVHAAVTFLIEHLPERVCFAIGSRADPPLPLARLRAREQMAELRAAQLGFTPEETHAFVRDVYGTQLALTESQALCAYAEGWPAGVQLLTLALRSAQQEQALEVAAAAATSPLRPTLARLDASQRHVFAYLADDVFERQPPHLKAFLLQTAILDRMCGPLCDATLGLETSGLRLGEDYAQPATSLKPLASQAYSQLILEQIERANLFLVPLDGEGRWYRYHHLFHVFLRMRLAVEPPGALAELHRRASAWFEQYHLWPEAVKHALAAGDSGRAAALSKYSTSVAAVGQPMRAPCQLQEVLELTAEAGIARDRDAPMTETAAWARSAGRHGPDEVFRASTTRAHAVLPAKRGGAGSEHGRLLELPQASFDGASVLVEALSERELEVLRLIAGGASNQTVAAALVISLGTVKSHINHILGKLAASNRTEAVARARDLGLLDGSCCRQVVATYALPDGGTAPAGSGWPATTE